MPDLKSPRIFRNSRTPHRVHDRAATHPIEATPLAVVTAGSRSRFLDQAAASPVAGRNEVRSPTTVLRAAAVAAADGSPSRNRRNLGPAANGSHETPNQCKPAAATTMVGSPSPLRETAMATDGSRRPSPSRPETSRASGSRRMPDRHSPMVAVTDGSPSPSLGPPGSKRVNGSRRMPPLATPEMEITEVVGRPNHDPPAVDLGLQTQSPPAATEVRPPHLESRDQGRAPDLGPPKRPRVATPDTPAPRVEADRRGEHEATDALEAPDVTFQREKRPRRMTFRRGFFSSTTLRTATLKRCRRLRYRSRIPLRYTHHIGARGRNWKGSRTNLL